MCKIFRPLRSLAMVLSIFTVMLSFFAVNAVAADIQIETSSKGLFVHTYQNRDFPSKNGLSSKELKNELSELVSFAKKCGYTTIYFEAVPSADAMYHSKVYPNSGFWLNRQGDFSLFDPMSFLIDEAKKSDIVVYAVINPFRVGTSTTILDNKNIAYENPDLAIPMGDNIFLNPSSEKVHKAISDISNELIKKYDIGGIALSGIDNELVINDSDYIKAVYDFVTKLSGDIDKVNTSTKFGVIFDALNRDFYTNIRSWSDAGSVDFVIPMISSVTNSNYRTYKSVLDNMKSITVNSATKLYTGNMASRLGTISSDGESFLDPNEINYQLFINYQSNVDGFVMDSYGTMKKNLSFVSENITTMFSTSAMLYSDTALNIPNTFSVTRPSSDITTNYSTYFVTGTSVPGLPVYVDSILISSDPVNGVFGSLVSLNEGENTFTVTHNGNQFP